MAKIAMQNARSQRGRQTSASLDMPMTSAKRYCCRRAPTSKCQKKKVQEASRLLQVHSEPFGYSQNKDKEVIIPAFCGKGSTAEIREMIRKKPPSTWCDEAKYLGILLNSKLITQNEVKSRVRAARVQFFSYMGFWKIKSPHRLKRTIFLSKVLGTLLSGLEPFCLLEGQVAFLEGALAGMARIALRGKGAQQDKITGAWTSWSNSRVLRYWQIAPVKIELLVRRLSWLQDWAKNAAAHQQVLTAMFSETRFEKQRRKQLQPHPWLLQLRRDITHLSEHEELEWLVEAVLADPLSLFANPDYAVPFAEADLACIKVRLWAASVPPPGHEAPSQAVARDPHGLPFAFVCLHKFPDGTPCAHQAPCRRSMANHVRFTHSWRHLVPMLTVTNQCPHCLSLFAAQRYAVAHVIEAVRSGICQADLGKNFLNLLSQKHLLVLPVILNFQTCFHFSDMSGSTFQSNQQPFLQKYSYRKLALFMEVEPSWALTANKEGQKPQPQRQLR